jgi:hypothetical protein
MSLHKLKSLDNDDLATFGRLVSRPIAATGAAAVNLDHQPKATDNRGRYALGGVHKLNGLPACHSSPRASSRWASDCAV